MELHSAEPKAQELGHGLTGGVKELGHDVAGLLKNEPKEEEAKEEEPKEELTSVKKWKYTLITTIIFLLVANPYTYTLVNSL